MITVSISIGTREPATHTALVRAILAFSDTATVEKMLDGASLKRYTDRSIANDRELRKIFAAVRDERLAFDNEEYKPGIVCFVSPVFDHRSRVVCSIGISGPRDLILPHHQDYGEMVRHAGPQASALLGHSERMHTESMHMEEYRVPLPKWVAP